MSINVELNGNQKETPKYIIIGCPDDKKAMLLAKLVVEEKSVHFIENESDLTIIPVAIPRIESFPLTCQPDFPEFLEVAQNNDVPFWRNLPSKKGKRRK